MTAPTVVRTMHAPTTRPVVPAPAEEPERRRWPIVVGAVAVVAIAGTALWFAQSASSSTGAFGPTLEVGYLSGDETQEAVLEYVANEIGPRHGITIEPTPLADPHGLARAVEEGRIAGTIHAHEPWVAQANKAYGWDLSATGPVFQWSYSLYSEKYASIDALRAAMATRTEPLNIAYQGDDAGSVAQALVLLSSAGLITLNPAVAPGDLTLNSIVSGTEHVTLTTISPGKAAESLENFDAIVASNAEFASIGESAQLQIYAPHSPASFAAQLTVDGSKLEDPGVQNLVEAFSDPALQNWLRTSLDHRILSRATEVTGG